MMTLTLFVKTSLYESCIPAVKPVNKSTRLPRADDSHSRWLNIIDCDDEKTVWNSMNWNGSFSTSDANDITPSDGDFAEFFASLLNISNEQIALPDNNIYIPLLDDPITTTEIHEQLRTIKPNKAAGHDGIPP
eukprot:GHVR01127376.1.p1 GENE.GHVR01127376.1~~GHVR01127376.1.p1  ORF type:complete len:133 (+),score=16.85 GHVR01127376.1:326-724(+)